VVLTEAGLALVPYADRALSSAAECLRAGRGDLGPAPLELVIGTRHELGLSWLVPMLPRLRQDNPGLTCHLYFGSGADLTLRVRTLEIDCAVTSSRLTDPKLDSIKLHREDYVFVGQPKLLRRNPFETAEHASSHTLLDVTEELPLFRYWRDAPGGVDSMEFAQVLRVGTIAAIRELALRGEGVAVLPEYFVKQDIVAKRLRRIMTSVEPLSDHFRLVFRTDDPRRASYTSVAATMLAVPLR
jgi:DNA-binding transcriptional LysR family regulator